MRSLHPLSLSELGLGPTLKELTKEWQRRHPVMSIKLHFDEEVNELRDDITIHLFRIVQECLTNAVRHAQASHVDVSVLIISDDVSEYIQIIVADNGVGGDIEGHGFGVRSMQERVENMQGTFSFTSKAGAGVQVTATIPLSN
jgi:two-component system sensor histidine kinase UhpB